MSQELKEASAYKTAPLGSSRRALPENESKREIPVEAPVEGTDGVCGRSVYVLINPVTEKLSHLVVRDAEAPHTEYIVPVETVESTMGGTIHLRCSRADMARMAPFIQTEYIQNTEARWDGSMYGQNYATGQYFLWPYVDADRNAYERVDHREIPVGELAVRRGTHVEALDGSVGHVDEFVVNSENGHMTHLVMRQGHPWAPKEVIIPISAVGEVRHDTVYLTLDKQGVEALPTFPVKRRWA